jgi:hypothetical protein
VLLPESPVGQILQEELRTAERYQRKLLILRKVIRDQPPLHLVVPDKAAIENRKEAGKPLKPSGVFSRDKVTEVSPATWQAAACELNIPKEYWPTADLKPFCAESEWAWWKFIWSRLRAKQKEILLRLRKSGEGRAQAKSGPLYLKHFWPQFRKHWLTLVSQR